ncbi:MAG TPA: ABC transporter permease [Vicinamibacterales bacterium]|nr:ABC transporter permease [Vicinamibacterales bacterium]
MTDATTTAPAPAPRSAAPGMLSSAGRVFGISVGEMLWSKRTIFMGLVVGAPVAIAFIVRFLVWLGLPVGSVEGVRITGPAIFGGMIWILYLRIIVPILGVFYGTALIADEVEDKTITYLFTRPVRRGAILLGKYLAYLAVTGFVVLPSVVLVYLLIASIGSNLGASFIPVLKDLALLAIGLAVYGAVFAFVGAQFKRPILLGLFYAFGWEQIALLVPGYLRRFTIAYYLQGPVPHAMPQEGVVSLFQAIVRDTPTLASSLFWLAVIWAGFLALGMRAVERREYILEQ